MDFKFFYLEGQQSLKWNTDKGTNHSYIEHYYNKEFNNKRYDTISLLEIGIWKGDSIKLWKEWFIKGDIYGIDDYSGIFGNKVDIVEIENVRLSTKNAYNIGTLDDYQIQFDYIIDDGPHTFESHKFCIVNWLTKLKKGGKLIIEDIYYCSDEYPLEGNELKNLIDTKLYEYHFYDFRNLKNRGDDIILEIIKK